MQNAFWGRRKKSKAAAEAVYEVSTTVGMFNAVTERVITTVLWHDPDLTPKAARARIIECWIDVSVNDFSWQKNELKARFYRSRVNCDS